MSEAIKVVVRVRPMNAKQKERGCHSIVNADQTNNQLSLTKPDEPDNIKNFAFDNVFNEASQQDLVYSKTAYTLVENVLLGYNGTIFAYGQTGCGKTHSMIGKVDVEELQGIIPRSFGHILKSISETTHKQFLIRCSFIEIYNEEVRDLLGKDPKAKLDVKQSPDKGIFIKDLSMNQAKTHKQLMEFMNEGNRNRATGETAMNKESSRSHLLFMVSLESAEISDDNSEDKKYVASKLNLVDLAGSERLSKTGAAGDRLKEAQKINLSLSALGNVISALVDGKSQHIPYRDSKLTRLLQDSLGGNTKTVMIANCSPADYNFDETISTLRYASRAKFIKNKPIINEDPKDALLKQYAEEIKMLKNRLQGQGGDIQMPIKSNENQNAAGGPEHQEINAKLREKQVELSNEKMEKERLLEKIHSLEAKHFEAKDVHIDDKLKKNVQKARISLENNINFMKISKIRQKQQQAQQVDEQTKLIQQIQKTPASKQTAEQYKNILKKYKTKVRNLEMQLKDINHENYMDKEILLDDVRSITRQNKLLEGIINIMMLPNQLETVKQASEYNEDKQEYRTPPFYFKNKTLIFPKLQENQSMEMIRQMQEGRNLQWGKQRDKENRDKEKEKSKDFEKNNALKSNHCLSPNYGGSQVLFTKGLEAKKGDNCIRDVIREARTEQNVVQPNFKEEKRNPRKLQLDPIKKDNRPLQG